MKLLKYIVCILLFFALLYLMTDICYHIDILYTYMVYIIQLFRNGSLYPRGMWSLLLTF